MEGSENSQVSEFRDCSTARVETCYPSITINNKKQNNFTL
jgi:hypothetical protein